MSKKKLYIVETMSIFRMRYVVKAKEASHAEDEVICNDDLVEFSQKHLDEIISSTREISEEEYLKLFDRDNDYLASWENDRKFSYINKINYTK
jgi:hypothetical protein